MKKCKHPQCLTEISKDAPEYCPEHNAMNELREEWEKEFDEKFGNYGMVSPAELDMLEEEIKFRLSIKSFIKDLLQKQLPNKEE